MYEHDPISTGGISLLISITLAFVALAQLDGHHWGAYFGLSAVAGVALVVGGERLHFSASEWRATAMAAAVFVTVTMVWQGALGVVSLVHHLP